MQKLFVRLDSERFGISHVGTLELQVGEEPSSLKLPIYMSSQGFL